jgi:hypothetical protein
MPRPSASPRPALNRGGPPDIPRTECPFASGISTDHRPSSWRAYRRLVSEDHRNTPVLIRLDLGRRWLNGSDLGRRTAADCRAGGRGRAGVAVASGDQPVAACYPAGGHRVAPAGTAGAGAVTAEAVAGGAGRDLPGPWRPGCPSGGSRAGWGVPRPRCAGTWRRTAGGRGTGLVPLTGGRSGCCGGPSRPNWPCARGCARWLRARRAALVTAADRGLAGGELSR